MRVSALAIGGEHIGDREGERIGDSGERSGDSG